MPRSWLAALALGVLAVLSIFVLLPDGEPNLFGDPVAQSIADEAEAEAVSIGEAPAESAGDPEQAERAEIESEAAPELDRVEFESYPGANGTLVTVLDKESGDAVEGAELLVCLREEIEEDALETALVSGTETLENIMRKYGHRYRTGADGKVMVQPLTEYPMLYARLGNRSGFAYQIEPGVTEVEVLLERDLGIKIQVVDDSGASVARAPVALRMISDEYQFALFTRDTNEKGVLKFENMRPYLMSTIGGNARLELTVGALVDPKELTDQQRVVLNDAAFEKGEAVLVLPPTGRVLVRTTLPDGEPFDGEGTVHLRNSGSSAQSFGPPTGMSRPLVAGVAEFPHVVLGLDLVAEVFVKNAPGPDSGKGPGPTSAHQTAEIAIERKLRPIVRARLLDASGEALREAKFETRLITRHSGSNRNRGSSSRTDADGWFELEFEVRPADAGPDYQRKLQLVYMADDRSESEVELDLSHALRLGVNDFGELQLAPSAIVLQGRVVDQFGEPIAQANVLLQQARLGRDNEIRGWRTIHSLQTRSAADGRFVLQGELPDAPHFRLSVQAREFESYEEPIQPVGQEIEVLLNPGSFISGSVLVDAGIDLSHFQLSFVEGEDNTDWVSLQPVAGSEGEATFKFQAHPDIPYALVLQSEAGEPLYEQSGISTQRGETSTPPGLQPIDLRGRLRVIELKAVDSVGNAVDATFILRATEKSWNSKQAQDGVLTLPVAKELFEVTVQHPKHASVTLQQVSQSQVIRLEPALEITVSVPQRFLQKDAIALSVQMYPTSRGRTRGYSNTTRQDIDARGNATLYAPEPGSYRVSLSLFHEDGNQHRSRSISAGTIEVSSHGSVHVLEIDADRFEDAVSKLKKDPS